MIISALLSSQGYAFDFAKYRCIIVSCGSDDDCKKREKIKENIPNIRSFDEIIDCYRFPDIAGIIPSFHIDTLNSCACRDNNEVNYCLPFIQSPTDSTYPCSPKMLEIYKAQKEQEEATCKRFIEDWNANKYPCIFDTNKDNVDKCRNELYEKYCGGM
ncbi:hypothetical protein CQA53_10025 [Helicobacter didelphidarum]|uniref:Uncharacterized protein n=1 Tax=Helicobacter didelphidarum TaxID=2040648 RepID=A0A3D8I9T1_9HELI|nr:hypothetical protein CQA53_10025 [Helicobacter didelphidarum]